MPLAGTPARDHSCQQLPFTANALFCCTGIVLVEVMELLGTVRLAAYSPIHKATRSLVTGRSLQNGKMSMGNHRTERPPDPVLYGGRPSGSFVNSAVNNWLFPKKAHRNVPRGRSCHRLPFTAYGTFFSGTVE